MTVTEFELIGIHHGASKSLSLFGAASAQPMCDVLPQSKAKMLFCLKASSETLATPCLRCRILGPTDVRGLGPTDVRNVSVAVSLSRSVFTTCEYFDLVAVSTICLCSF